MFPFFFRSFSPRSFYLMQLANCETKDKDWQLAYPSLPNNLAVENAELS